MNHGSEEDSRSAVQDRIRLSIVIPCWNAASTLAQCLNDIAAGTTSSLDVDILIVDGGSNDDTTGIAERNGASVIRTEKGRGKQLAEGGRVATGDWLMFLHADTKLTADWGDCVCAFASDPCNLTRAAVFTYALDDDHPAARRVERMVAIRCFLFSLPYGDQGLIISRHFYDLIGGFMEIPLMEDVDIIRRIDRKSLAYLDAKAITSPIRYHRGGYWRRPLFHLVCLSLYFLGVPPKTLESIYG